MISTTLHMKRFLVFTFDQYYPNGGWEDFQESFETLEAAKNFLINKSNFDFYQVVDLEENGNIVFEGQRK